ncbi:MAG: hypothetical protein WED10_05890 [Brumimicrobium sp.]
MKNLKNERANTEGAQNEGAQNKNSQNKSTLSKVNQNNPEKNSNDKTNKSSDNFQMSGNWSDQSKNLKSKYSQLTDEDLKVESGKENEMIQRMETRLDMSRDEVIDILEKGQSKSA